MRLLIAEDEDSKRQRLRGFLEEAYPDASIVEARSVRSANATIRVAAPDLLLLDMSLPTYDIAAGEPGGRPQGFGGIEVVRYMERDGLNVPTIVVTQHPAIPKDGQLIALSGIEEMVRKESPSNYRGLVYYDTLTGGWKKELLNLIESFLNKPEGEE